MLLLAAILWSLVASQGIIGPSFFVFSSPLLCSSQLTLLLDANLIAPTGLVALLKVKDIVETPNCLPASRFRPLTDQIIGQTNCRANAAIIASISNPRIDTSLCETPYLLAGPFESLVKIANDPLASAVEPMVVTEALQPFLNQYFSFRRGYLRICGQVDEVPYVGTTTQERGASIVLANADVWAPFFATSSSWTRIDDTFTYVGPDVLDVSRRMLETFQIMWTVAFPTDPIAPTGSFDTETQLRVEQALTSGITFPGLCSSVISGPLSDDTVLMLVLLVPMSSLVAIVALLMLYQNWSQTARTPFDTRRDGSDEKQVLELPEGDLHNSVENSTDLSEYARSTTSNGEDGWTTEATSGIWDDDE